MKNQKKKDLLLLAMKLLQKIPDAINAKAYYQSYLKRKTKKLVKRSKINTQQRKALENQNILDIKTVIIKHPKSSHKLSKTVRHTGKVSQVSGPGKNSNSP